MRVGIQREREERFKSAGWFTTACIPAYCIFLTLHFSEEERFQIAYTGIGRHVFFQAPIPPDIADPEKIKRMKADKFGLFFVSDLIGWGNKTLLGIWPDLIAADEAEVGLRIKLQELADNLARSMGATETSVVFEL